MFATDFIAASIEVYSLKMPKIYSVFGTIKKTMMENVFSNTKVFPNWMMLMFIIEKKYLLYKWNEDQLTSINGWHTHASE